MGTSANLCVFFSPSCSVSFPILFVEVLEEEGGVVVREWDFCVNSEEDKEQSRS
jgi:hypothetical protein